MDDTTLLQCLTALEESLSDLSAQSEKFKYLMEQNSSLRKMLDDSADKVEGAVQLEEYLKLTTLQLSQIETELEYFFLLSRKQKVLLETSVALQKRALDLAVSLLNK